MEKDLKQAKTQETNLSVVKYTRFLIGKFLNHRTWFVLEAFCNDNDQLLSFVCLFSWLISIDGFAARSHTYTSR